MKYSILLIEDYQPLVHAIEEKMAMLDITCYPARSVDEALSMLSLHPDISLLWVDHHLIGDKTGLDFLRSAYEDKGMKKLPVIVVSNETNLDRIAEYKGLGALKYFSKVETTLDEIGNSVLELLETTQS
jgi:DNA-binding NtrC family response regulator